MVDFNDPETLPRATRAGLVTVIADWLRYVDDGVPDKDGANHHGLKQLFSDFFKDTQPFDEESAHARIRDLCLNGEPRSIGGLLVTILAMHRDDAWLAVPRSAGAIRLESDDDPFSKKPFAHITAKVRH